MKIKAKQNKVGLSILSLGLATLILLILHFGGAEVSTVPTPDPTDPVGLCQLIIRTRSEDAMTFNPDVTVIEAGSLVTVDGVMWMKAAYSYNCVLNYDEPLASRVHSISISRQ